MTNNDKPVAEKLSKKEARKLVYERLALALADYRPRFKEKKFESNLKKASRLFASDLAKTIGKKKERKQNGKKRTDRKTEVKVQEFQTTPV